MAVSFDSIAFVVLVDGDGRLPAPVPDENGLDVYTATIKVASLSILNSLRALRSSVDPIAGMSGGGILEVRWGPGQRELIYPIGAGDEIARYAVLFDWQPHPSGFYDNHHTVDVSWYVGEVVEG